MISFLPSVNPNLIIRGSSSENIRLSSMEFGSILCICLWWRWIYESNAFIHLPVCSNPNVWVNIFQNLKFFFFLKDNFRISFNSSWVPALCVSHFRNHRWAEIQVVVNNPGTEYSCFLSPLPLSLSVCVCLRKLLSLAEFLSCLWFSRTNVENMNLLCSHLPEHAQQND